MTIAILLQILLAIPGLVMDVMKLWQLWRQIRNVPSVAQRETYKAELTPLLETAAKERRIGQNLRDAAERIRQDIAARKAARG